MATDTDTVERFLSDIPKNLSPARGSQLDTTLPTFSWEGISDPNIVFYRVMVEDLENRSLWERMVNPETTSVQYNDDGKASEDLLLGYTYFWMIKAGDGEGNSASKRVGTFRIGPPRTLQVDVSNTTGIEDGSAEHPFDSIQEGIDEVFFGERIEVAPGTYGENIDFGDKNIVVVSIAGPRDTIIDGSGKAPCVFFYGEMDGAAKLDGFTLRNGESSYGGGVWIQSAGPTLENLIIEDNHADMQGGGVFIKWGKDPVLRNVSICRNRAGNQGGGIHVCAADSLLLENVIVAENAGWQAGGLYADRVDMTVWNCVVARNVGTSGFVGGARIAGDGNVVAMANTIVYDNYPDNLSLYGYGNLSRLEVSYSCIQGGEGDVEVSGDIELDWLSGNIDANPGFQDFSQYDFRLQAGSPCIDAGDMDSARNDPDGSRGDMGAFGGPLGQTCVYADGPPYIFKQYHADPRALPPGEQTRIVARVEDFASSTASVFANVKNQTGSTDETLELFDDGAHGDGDLGDGVYGAAWTTPSGSKGLDGSDGDDYMIIIVGSDSTGHSTRPVALDTISTKSEVSFDNVRMQEAEGNDGIPNPGESLRLVYDVTYNGPFDSVDVLAVKHLDDPVFYPDTLTEPNAYCDFIYLQNGVVEQGRSVSCEISSEAVQGHKPRLLVGFYDVFRDPVGHLYYEFDGIGGSDTFASEVITPSAEPAYAETGGQIRFEVTVHEPGPLAEVKAEVCRADGTVVGSVPLAPDSGVYEDAYWRIFSGVWTVSEESDFFIRFFAKDIAGNVGQSRVGADFTSKPPLACATADVLLVDDDLANQWVHGTVETPLDQYCRDALDSIGVRYDIWNTNFYGSPSSAFLGTYTGMVVWECGNSYPETLDDAERTALSSYLEGGGRLFVSGQFIALDLGGWDCTDQKRQFLNDYLHAEYADFSSQFAFSGIDTDPVSSGLSVEVYGGDGADYFMESAVLDVLAPAVPIFEDEDGKRYALKVDTGSFRLVFLSFGFEGVNKESDRNTLMYRIAKWLMGDGPVLACDLDYDFDLDLDDAELGLSVAAGHADSPNAVPNAFLDGERVTGFDVAYIMQTGTESPTRWKTPRERKAVPISTIRIRTATASGTASRTRTGTANWTTAKPTPATTIPTTTAFPTATRTKTKTGRETETSWIP